MAFRIRGLRLALGFFLLLALFTPVLAASSESKLSKLLNLLGDEDWAIRQQASLELGEMPPRMLRALAKRNVEEKEFVHREYRFLIAMARQRLALSNEGTAEQLWKEMGHDEYMVHAYAARSLALTRGGIVPELVTKWPGFDSKERELALAVLAWRGAEAASALALALESLEEHPWIAAWACGRVAPGDPKVLEVAQRILEDGNTENRQIWLWVLERAGAAGVPGLIRALEDSDLREEASVRLAVLGSVAAPGVLAAYDESKSARVRGLALRVLAVVGKEDPEVVARILAATEDSSPTVRAEAIIATTSLDLEEDVRCALLRRGLEDRSSKVRSCTRDVVATLGQEAACVGLDLVRSWKEAMPTNQTESLLFASAFMEMKQLTPEAASAFLDFYLDCPLDLADEVESALAFAAKECSPSAAEIFLERFETLEGPAAKIRGILFLMGIAEAALPQIQKMAGLGDRRYFPAIFRCLGALGEWPQDLREFVEASWEDEELREQACYALIGGGESIADLRARCLAGFDSYTPEVQAALLGAVSAGAPEAPEFLELLIRLATSEQSAETRLRVADALGWGESSAASRVVALIAMIDNPQGGEEAKNRKKFGDLLSDLSEFTSKEEADTSEKIRDNFRLLARLEEVQSGIVGEILDSLRSFTEIQPGQLDSIAELMLVPDLHTQVNAIKTLAHFGVEAGHLAEDFALNLRGDPHIFLKIQSLLALRAIEGRARPALCDLATTLTGQPAEAGFYAAEALNNMGAGARPVLPNLLFALVNDQYTRAEWSRPQKDEGPYEGGYNPYRGGPAYREIRMEIAGLVAEIGLAHPEDASWIRPVLERVAQDPDGGVAAAAEAALEKLGSEKLGSEAAHSDR